MRRKTFEEVEKEVTELGNGEYQVFPPYHNSKEKIKFVHTNCGFTFRMRFNSFKNGQRCPHCGIRHSSMIRSKTTEDFVNEVNDYYGVGEYTVLGPYINADTLVKVRHNKCGNTYMSRPADLIRGHGCKECSYVTRASKIGVSQRTPLCEVKQSIQSILGSSYVVLTKDSEYRGNRQKILIKHLDCGYIYQARYSDIQSKSNGCPLCSKRKASFGERTILECLSEKGYKIDKDFYYGYTGFDMRAKLKLHLDFYFPSLNLAIEYDGKQHFVPVNYFGGEKVFKTIQEHDRIKNEFCDKNGITLLRISYLKCTKKAISEALDKEISGINK